MATGPLMIRYKPTIFLLQKYHRLKTTLFTYHSWGVGINHLLFRSVLQVPNFPFKIILLLGIWIALPSYDVEFHHYSLHRSSRH